MPSIQQALPPITPVRTAPRAEVAPPHSRGRVLVERLTQLSTREVDVMVRLVGGKSSKAIAFDLGISFKTVECHRARIMEKLGCSGLFELGRAWEAAVWVNRKQKAKR